MPRALEIPIEVTRLDRAVDSVKQFSGSIRGVGTASETAAERASRSWGRAMEKIARDQERYLRVSGPAQRLQRATAAREAALGTGDEARIFDASAAVARATVGLERARRQQARTGGGSALDRAIGVLNSTRFNAGPVSPLIGRTAELLGVQTTGAAGLGVAGAAAAVGAFTLAVKGAVERLNEFGAAMRLSGGSAGDVAGIARFGFTGAGGAGAAEQFRQRIATDPMAMMFAARHGIRALPEPLGTVNNAAVLKQGVDALRGITDAEERLRTARVFGLESALKYIDVSPRVNELLDQTVALEKNIAESGGARAANDLSVSLDTLGRRLGDLEAVALPGVINKLNELIDTAARLSNRGSGGAAMDILSQQLNPFDPNFWRSKNPFNRQFWTGLPEQGGSDPQAKHRDALEANTKALKEHQEAMRAFFQPGQYGGGRYTQSGMPTGWSGDFLARQMESGALSKGIPGV